MLADEEDCYILRLPDELLIDILTRAINTTLTRYPTYEEELFQRRSLRQDKPLALQGSRIAGVLETFRACKRLYGLARQIIQGPKNQQRTLNINHINVPNGMFIDGTLFRHSVVYQNLKKLKINIDMPMHTNWYNKTTTNFLKTIEQTLMRCEAVREVQLHVSDETVGVATENRRAVFGRWVRDLADIMERKFGHEIVVET